MNKIYGYCRISTPKQNIERQVRNIIKFFPDAMIIQETFTGFKFQGRKELDKLVKSVKSATLLFLTAFPECPVTLITEGND